MREIPIVRVGDHPFCSYQIGERNVGDEEGLTTYLRSEGVDEGKIKQAVQKLKKAGDYKIRVL
jgi:hypothetical protein